MINRSLTKRRATIAGLLCASFIIILVFAASRSLIEGRTQRAAKNPVAAREHKAAEKPSPSPATKHAPRVVQNSPEDAELAGEINRLIDESEFAQARWGVFVTSMRDGSVLFSRNGDRAFTPASNMKIYTTAVALDLLGADYRWRTSVYASAAPDGRGTLAGDLILYGRGAPDLSSRVKKETPASLVQLADDLYKRGVRRVRGDVVGDESYFRGEPLGDGWLWNDVQWYFGAEVSALSVNDNEVNVRITPAGKTDAQPDVKFDLPTDYLRLTNDTNTVERGQPMTVGLTRGLSDNEVRVWGDFPAGGQGFSARISVHHPALWAASLFRDALKARGITVEGEARSRDSRSHHDDKSVAIQNAVELASFESRTLGQVVRATNKESINLNAELILRTLGKERGAMAPDANPQRMLTRGDDEAGLAVVLMWLNRAGIGTDDLALHDGSGLSRLDLVTPESSARLLAAIARTPAANVFRDSLPIAGRDGTLQNRLRAVNVAGRVLAKTGTLSYINSLSGYTTTADNEPLAFSIMCNDETEKASSTRIIDEIVTLLTSRRKANP
jgi:D-alanyl-D-alanine carboxypeptidase/D-alanyl-D-alanine-endopeptidase (penicillin-binding protein 4)